MTTPSPDRVRGALLGTAFGDALGMPIEHLSHQNVRLYYKGIKEFRADEKRGELEAGQWTGDTQRMLTLARVLTETTRPDAVRQRLGEAYRALLPDARRWPDAVRATVEAWGGDSVPDIPSTPTNGAAVTMAPVGAWWAQGERTPEEVGALLTALVGVTHRHPAAFAAAHGQAFAVRTVLQTDPADFDADVFWQTVHVETRAAEQRLGDADTSVSNRLAHLADMLDDFPLDLQDACGGTGPNASESWPFALAMFARNPHLPEATLLSAINVGGDANSVGAMCGALLGALNGAEAFPQAWHDGIEARDEIVAVSNQFLRPGLG